MIPFPGKIQRHGPGGKLHLTAEQEAWLRSTFPTHSDSQLVAAMGCGYMTVRRLARERQLHKTPEYMTTMYAAFRAKGIEAIKGRPLSAQHKSKIGAANHTNHHRDRVRQTIGLQPLTRRRIPVCPYTRSQIRARCNAVSKYNYLLDYPAPVSGPARYTIYYDNETERNAKFERFQTKHNHFTFLPT